MSVPLIIVFAVLIIILFMYAFLVGKRNMVDQVFATIDANLKKRYDLIPNLVAAVKEYMQHEKELITRVTELRTKALDQNLPNDQKVEVNNELSKALRSIFVAVENYPQLKANENFLQLQSSLNEVEEQISASRRAFNAAVTTYNNSVDMFPSSLIASIFGFQRRQLFEITEAERQNVDVKKLFNS